MRSSLLIAALLSLALWPAPGPAGEPAPGPAGEPASKHPPPRAFTITAVGDSNGYNILNGGRDSGDPLRDVDELLGHPDLFMLNFEGVLMPEGSSAQGCKAFRRQSLFRSAPRIADFLGRGRQTVATLANNHILDCGERGLLETVGAFAQRDIGTVGAGATIEEACAPLRLEINGARVALLAFLAIQSDSYRAQAGRAGPASWALCDGPRRVAELAASEDLVLVALHLHLGPGWTDRTHPSHVNLAHAVLGAGADIVIAHGPHMPQGVLQSGRGVALLSIGNFLFRPDYDLAARARRSVVAEFTVEPASLSLTLRPVQLDDSGRPRAASDREAAETLRDIAEGSAALGTLLRVREGSGLLRIARD